MTSLSPNNPGLKRSGSKVVLRSSRSGSLSTTSPAALQRTASRLTFDDATAAAIQLRQSLASAPDLAVLPLDEPHQVSHCPAKSDVLPLDMVTLRNGLSCMGPFPEGPGLVYLKLSLPNLELNNIDMLKCFKYIQTLHLSGNNLTDASVLANMKHLVELDMSNNRLTEVLNFDPPYNLQEADLSRNQIQTIRDLSQHRYLRKLCLDRNLILSIAGLSGCNYLTHLSLQRNGIDKIQGLDNLPLKFLDLSWNRIHVIENLHTLINLEELHLAHNSISSLVTMDVLPHLKVLSLDSNSLGNVSDVTETLAGFTMLRDLHARRNPISVLPEYRLVMGYSLPFLSTLDGLPLAVEDKIAAINRFDPPPEVVAAVTHANVLKRQIKHYAKLRAGDLQRARRLKPICLCGPAGVGKRTLTARLLKEYPHIYGLAVSHTTRKPRLGEENGVHYHFVDAEEMGGLDEAGAFVESVTLFGNQYGTSMSAIEKVTEEGKVCLMDLEIEGVLALKRSALKPYYIFVTVPSLDVLQQRLHSRITGNEPAKSTGDSSAAIPKIQPIPEDTSQPASRPNSEGTIRVASPKTGISLLSKGGNRAREPKDVLEKDPEVRKWLAKAHVVERFGKAEGFFDCTIVNLDLENAYQELRIWCLKKYEEAYDEDE
ncbi:guanylate kinase [Synchytrium endobioticum]|uniref:Guanylate kinase n=1 Tax=Synchytrium endobioticum TaxID=286115 RepID=A0A507CN01_9FUNG|nr:guanylate kinase [Synchytrium endobioticum]